MQAERESETLIKIEQKFKEINIEEKQHYPFVRLYETR